MHDQQTNNIYLIFQVFHLGGAGGRGVIHTESSGSMARPRPAAVYAGAIYIEALLYFSLICGAESHVVRNGQTVRLGVRAES